MSSPPIISLNKIGINVGEKTIFQDVTTHLYAKDRVCLVGRNGCGKSTLLKVLSGLRELDKGSLYIRPGCIINCLSQDYTTPMVGTVQDVFHDYPAYEVSVFTHALDIDLDQECHTLSGGQIRRVGLALALLGRPHVLLLDEPTNHLDLPAIQWLEDYLRQFNGAVIVISHDRRFLSTISNRIWWLERGTLYNHDKGFVAFEAFSDQIYLEEENKMAKLETKLAQELHWLHRGVTARRRRNQGRLRQLQQLRQEKSVHQSESNQGVVFTAIAKDMGSKLVVETHHLGFSYGEKKMINDLNIRILRGERVGIIGGNGTGKTTLLKLLTGKLKPDQGTIQWGASGDLIYLDQMHEDLKPDQTLWDFLCPGGGDQLIVQGKPYHVVSYLKNFLFTSAQALSPIGILSGGEKNRLFLAKALAQPCNVLILDEPTNDLDMETLDLLQEILNDFHGTLLIVSHDRDFLDRTVTSILTVKSGGHVKEYVGGYSDYIAEETRHKKINQSLTSQLITSPKVETKRGTPLTKTPAAADNTSATKKRLSYGDQRTLDLLPNKMQDLQKKMKSIEDKLEDGTLYTTNVQQFHDLTKKLETIKHDLEHAENQWLTLSMM